MALPNDHPRGIARGYDKFRFALTLGSGLVVLVAALAVDTIRCVADVAVLIIETGAPE